MPWERRVIETAGGPFLVYEGGDPAAPALVLLHDEIATAPGAFGDALAADRRVVAPVLPGFGEADRPSWIETVRDVADHLQLLFEEGLDLAGPVPMVGTSMGAWVALELALRLQDGLGSLSLLAPVGIRVKGAPAADFWYERRRDEILFNDRAHQPEVPLEEQVANEESAARYGWSPRLHDPTLPARLVRLRTPTQLVWSDDDRLLPKEHLAAWEQQLPSAQVDHVDAGHFATYEAPRAAADAVLRFVTATTEERAR